MVHYQPIYNSFTMSTDVPLSYSPIQSFFDSSFFTALATKKLNEYKLDSSAKPINAFMASPKLLNKFNDQPVLNFDYSSFELQSSDDKTHRINGVLYEVNTIEEFKNFNKLDSLREWGNQLRQEMKHGVFEPKFYLLNYSDLKKYRFYYWLAFPVLHSQWITKATSSNNEYELQIKEYLDKGKDAFLQVLENGDIVPLTSIEPGSSACFAYVDSCLSPDLKPLIQLKNYLYYLALKGVIKTTLLIYRNDGKSYSLLLELEPYFDVTQTPKVTGWERTAEKKLGPKMANLGSLIDPKQFAEQAVDLNLRLMKWRVAPHIDLDIIKAQKVLLLGAGTLGSYVSRALMAWGVRKITFVDSGRVSHSNPVRQPLFNFKDCYSESNCGRLKAERASEALKEIFLGAESEGHVLEVPMIGHPVSDLTVETTKGNFEKLEKLFEEHDVIFILMDSRESRWLPTVMGTAMNKTVINAAIGFDSYLVIRHSQFDSPKRLGCYFCNDIVAPTDSLADRSLDQMCTVTRPGGALMASSIAVELLMSILQHPSKASAAINDSSHFGDVPHQIRGFLNNFTQTKLSMPAYPQCSACSVGTVEGFREEKWEFVKKCLNSPKYLEEVSGLEKVQREADEAAERLMHELDLIDDDF